MRKLVLAFICIVIAKIAFTQNAADLEKIKVALPNGWNLTPIGKQISLDDLPLNMAVASSKKMIAVTNNGQSTQSIQLIDLATEKIISETNIPKSWYGLKFSENDKVLYASGGNDNWILKYSIEDKKIILKDSIILGKKWPNKISPTGIDVDDASKRLFVVTKDDNTLYVIDLTNHQIIHTVKLEAEAYSCLLSKDKKTLFISVWGGKKIIYYDIESNKIEAEVKVGDHPNEILLSKNNKYLFVANANDNTVSVIDVQQQKVIETLNAALYPNAPTGSTTNGLALSEDERKLYVANADNNCLAVFDISALGKSKSIGFIPTGWYPTNVKVIGKKIYVTNGKGLSSFANPNGPGPYRARETVTYQQGDAKKPSEVQYIGGLFKGTLSIIDEPNEKQLNSYAQQVYKNTPYSKEKELLTEGEKGNPIPMKVGDKSPIKYVFYIIKENRTFDQVLSDVKGGNGDTSLLLFGEKFTPNQHALVKNFVLLDNFYCDAEVSADGHSWSMGAYATDYVEKNWPSSYGGRGGDYPSEGMKKMGNNKDGFFWDLCKRGNVSFRNYGEFADHPNKPNVDVLQNHCCLYYAGWDMNVRDTTRMRQWQKDFDSLIAINAVPQFNTIRMGNDHTEGLRVGRPTPYAHVADNDLAIGMFVEYLSHSSIWKESAVFIVEDDAQNGPDHVDAHRTTAYVISPYVKRNHVDHAMYSTSSMVRTMELILGLPPMTQYDAAAKPMWQSFTTSPDFSSFTHISSNVDLNEKNKAVNKASAMSAKVDFSKEDAVPDLVFNDILWLGLKGTVAPAPSRAAFVKLSKKNKKEDKD